MSTSILTGWPIRRSASCVSLKLASIQISVSERTAIRLWPACDVVAGVHVAARDDAVDLRDDSAVRKVQLGLVQVFWRRSSGGLGLLDGRRVFEKLRVDAVDVAFRIAIEKSVDQFVAYLLNESGTPSGGRGLHQLRLGFCTEEKV